MKLLAQAPRQYIVGAPRSMLKKFEQQLLSQTWKSIREGLEVQYCSLPEYGEEVFILCRGAERKTKKHTITERSRQKVEAGLAKLQQYCAKSQRVRASVLERKIGRLLAHNPRVARWYHLEVQQTEEHKLLLVWSKDLAQQTRTEQSEGYYLLRTNVKHCSEEELWAAYVQLSHAEATFRTQKSDLKLRPVWHQKKDCASAFASLHMCCGKRWAALQEQGSRPRTRKVFDDIGGIQACDVILPAQSGAELKLRCVTKSDKHQNILLHHLGLQLPARLIQNPDL